MGLFDSSIGRVAVESWGFELWIWEDVSIMGTFNVFGDIADADDIPEERGKLNIFETEVGARVSRITS